jgi:hypothetical protein
LGRQGGSNQQQNQKNWPESDGESFHFSAIPLKRQRLQLVIKKLLDFLDVFSAKSLFCKCLEKLLSY